MTDKRKYTGRKLTPVAKVAAVNNELQELTKDLCALYPDETAIKTAVSRWLNGKRVPSDDKKQHIEAQLGICQSHWRIVKPPSKAVT